MSRTLNLWRYLDANEFTRLIEFLGTIGLVRGDPKENMRGFKTISLALPVEGVSFTSLPAEPPGLAPAARDAAFLVGLETRDTAPIYEAAKRMKLHIGFQDSDIEWSPEEPFTVSLPGKIILSVRPKAGAAEGALSGNLDARGKKFVVVVSRFNSFITERLLESALDGLYRAGAQKEDVSVVRVPGAFEIPSAARTLAETKKYDAIICIGCLLRGDTAHYDVIVNEVTRGIGQSAQETGVPHAFGVLTCDTLEQAIDRAGLKMGNKGFEAALAAIDMASLKRAISHQPSAVGQKQVPRSARNGKSNPARKLKAGRRPNAAKKKSK
jgi:6,7-dimethyl-8-ribityllumazine synthase